MIVDANLLLYATDETAAAHERARTWLESQLNGLSRVGLPWVSLLAFVRISTHPRAVVTPLSGPDAWRQVEAWLASDVVWTPEPTRAHSQVMRTLIERYNVAGNLVPDAHLAALAIEHGVAVASADSDFARFSDVRWVNPVSPT